MYLPPPPKLRPDPISPRAYALLKGRTYPEPLCYLASWSLVRHYASFPPATPEMWAEVFASLDAQRCKVDHLVSVHPRHAGTSGIRADWSWG